MPNKEATARIKINTLLQNAGWRFFADANGPANIQLEPSVTLKALDLDALGENFETAAKGFPLIVLEAKAEDKDPLIGKEQARKYAKSLNCRFVILPNGNLHYLWDLERGNPYIITAFPTPASIAGYQKSKPDPKRLIEETVADDYVVLTQRPGYAAEAAWKNEAERERFISTNGLRFLRPYQKKAIYAIQQAVAKGSDRFLLEMATGTGKTLTSAAIIKLFLRTGNAQRVLFLVDRLELEDQALKAFKKVLAGRYYHVLNRGNNRENLFIEERNYTYFLQLYAKYVAPVADTFAYCLLRNHFHLLIRVKDVQVQESDSMQRSERSDRLDLATRAFTSLFQSYSMAINKAYNRTGKLFQEHFARIEVTSDDYFTNLIFYIHFNPQKHGFVKDWRDWEWSSYSALLSHQPTKLQRDEVWAWFDGRERFVQFHRNAVDERLIVHLIEGDFE